MQSSSSSTLQTSLKTPGMVVNQIIGFDVDEEALKILGASSPLLFFQQNPEFLNVSILLRSKGEPRKEVLHYLRRFSDLKFKEVDNLKVIISGSVSEWRECYVNYDPVKHSESVYCFLLANWDAVISKGNSVFMLARKSNCWKNK